MGLLFAHRWQLTYGKFTFLPPVESLCRGLALTIASRSLLHLLLPVCVQCTGTSNFLFPFINLSQSLPLGKERLCKQRGKRMKGWQGTHPCAQVVYSCTVCSLFTFSKTSFFPRRPVDRFDPRRCYPGKAKKRLSPLDEVTDDVLLDLDEVTDDALLDLDDVAGLHVLQQLEEPVLCGLAAKGNVDGTWHRGKQSWMLSWLAVFFLQSWLKLLTSRFWSAVLFISERL